MHNFDTSRRIGLRVLYMLTDYDVREIRAERQKAGNATAHGNEPGEGSIYPGIIVADWSVDGHTDASANLQVWLDGNDSFWPTSRSEFDPAVHGVRHYLTQDHDGGAFTREITFDQYQRLAGPNDVGMGEATAVVTTFEPDARGHWIARLD